MQKENRFRAKRQSTSEISTSIDLAPLCRYRTQHGAPRLPCFGLDSHIKPGPANSVRTALHPRVSRYRPVFNALPHSDVAPSFPVPCADGVIQKSESNAAYLVNLSPVPVSPIWSSRGKPVQPWREHIGETNSAHGYLWVKPDTFAS
jgi:hypothetical protein